MEPIKNELTVVVSYHYFARQNKLRYLELSKGITNDSLLEELRKNTIPWTPGHLKSESISQEFLLDDLMNKPIKLDKNSSPHEKPKGLIKKDLDENNIDV